MITRYSVERTIYNRAQTLPYSEPRTKTIAVSKCNGQEYEFEGIDEKFMIIRAYDKIDQKFRIAVQCKTEKKRFDFKKVVESYIPTLKRSK